MAPPRQGRPSTWLAHWTLTLPENFGRRQSLHRESHSGWLAGALLHRHLVRWADYSVTRARTNCG